jgi:hypothetical protein
MSGLRMCGVRGAPKAGLPYCSPSPNWNFKNKFCGDDDIKGFTWLAIHPKSADDCVHYNFEKEAKKK